MTDAAFTYLADVDRIEIHMDCANIVSARVAGKVGYRLLHTEQREKLALGHTGEGYVWQKRRDEWTPPPRPQVPHGVGPWCVQLPASDGRPGPPGSRR